MTAPIEVAYAALAAAVAEALVESDFLPADDVLEIDPPSAFEPSGDETSFVKAAALLKLKTGPTQTFLGGGTARYEVERQCRVELAVAGPDAAGRLAALDAAVAAIAALATTDPTLSGKTLRLVLDDAEDDDLPPNGAKKLLTMSIAVRSNDALGMS